MTDFVLVLTTVPIGEPGETIARALIEERLAACVHLHPPVTSFYRWQGTLERDVERPLVIKTTRAMVAALSERLGQLHPYEVPELVVIEVADGSSAYLDWVRRSVGESPQVD